MSYDKYYPNGWQSGEAGGTAITPEALDHIEKGVAGALPKDGTDPMAGDLPMGGHKVTGLGTPTAEGDAVPLGYANQNFAPAGYVSGDYGIRDYDSLDALLGTIYSRMPDRSVNLVRIADNTAIEWGGGGCIVMIYKEDSDYGVAEFFNYNYQGSELRKCLYGGVWQPLEYDNPPMVPGVEYRTTERWYVNGVSKPLYVMELNYASIANDMVITPSGYGTMRVIEMVGEATLSDGNTILIPGRYESWEAYFDQSYGYSAQPRLKVSDGHIIIGRPLTVRLKYWKSTD